MDNEDVVGIGSFILKLGDFEIPGDIYYSPNDATYGGNAVIIRVPQTEEMVTAAMKYMGISSQDDVGALVTTIRAGDEGGPAVAIVIKDTRAA